MARSSRPRDVEADAYRRLMRVVPSQEKWLSQLNRLYQEGESSKGPPSLFQSESDEAVVLIGRAVVDHALELALRSHFMPRSGPPIDTLFAMDGAEGEAPLASLSTKARLSFALGLIDETVRQAITRMRRIRNVFAHRREFISFEDEDVRLLCSGLTYSWTGTPTDSSPRKAYVETAFWVCVRIDHYITKDG